jgi:hypothetical protein
MIGCNQDACGLIRISQHPPMFIAAVNGFGLGGGASDCPRTRRSNA